MIINNKAQMRTTAGQTNSHFVYCSLSGFWQHFDGQHPGQQQQQQRKGGINKIRMRPRAKGPTKSPSEVEKLGSYWTAPAMAPSGWLKILFISSFLDYLL